MKRNTFMSGAIILIIFNLIGKVLGAVYRIPLSRILGSVGMGKYQLVFPLYALILTICTSGVPVVVSKLVAECNAKGEKYKAKRVLRTSAVILFFTSLIGALILVFGAKGFSLLEGNRDIYICFYAIAPAIMFAGELSVFRGYFQGNLSMFPTALSGFVEQVAKITIGLYLARQLLVFGELYAVFGAVLGVAISEFCSFVFLLICYFVHSKKHKKDIIKMPVSQKFLAKQIISMSAPITLSGMVSPLSSMVDSLLVVNILIFLGYSSKNATMMLGVLSGIIEPLVNIPTILSVSIATALLPSVSHKKSENSNYEMKEMIEKAIQISLSISLVFFVCFIIFGKQILEFLYGFSFSVSELNLAVKLLFFNSVNIIFLSLIQVFSSVLQGLNSQKYVMKVMLAGCGIKLVLDVALISVKSINILGAVISGGVGYFVVMVLMFKKLKKLTFINFSGLYFYTIIQVCAVCVVAYFMNLILRVLLSDTIAMFLAGGISVVVFFISYYFLFIYQKNKRESSATTWKKWYILLNLFYEFNDKKCGIKIERDTCSYGRFFWYGF